ncbi:hypothetical protein TKK_0008892 [Trichogramma kaykai]|uniref:Coiled-coil domain-containing protein n=1 Tax=Trichogramma kaykai TaxID=54128 RepID=A0ABD2X483_9HYME
MGDYHHHHHHQQETDRWSGGLIRSYSEHAALVLQHYQNHRPRAYSDNLKCTRSGPDFRRRYDDENDEEARQEQDSRAFAKITTSACSIFDDEQQDNNDSDGQRTWRMPSNYESSFDESSYAQRRKIGQDGAGDSSALTTDISQLSLTDECQPQKVVCFESANTLTSQETHSSVDRRCIIFDNDDEHDDEHLVFVEDDDEDATFESEYQFEQHPDNTRSPETSERTVSATSLQTFPGQQRVNGAPISRFISYEDWAQEKKRELQRRKDEEKRLEKEKRELEEQQQREKEKRDRERFLEWYQRKKREKERQRKAAEKKIGIQRKLKDCQEQFRNQKNDLELKQWWKKKEEQQKALEEKEKLKRKKAKEEKEKKIQESLKAYKEWREKAKNVPKPATQGLLPHQKAKPAFTNPTPWQRLVDNGSDDSDNDTRSKDVGLCLVNQKTS